MADRILVRTTVNLSGARCGDRVWVDPDSENIRGLLAGPNPILVPVPDPKVNAFRVQAAEPVSDPPAPVAPEPDTDETPEPVSDPSDPDPNPAVEQPQDEASV